jgi:PST family polysaccharide transporter
VSESDISIRHGVQWVGVAQISKSILYLISIIILARILPPSDYGLMAMGTVFLGFVAIFKDMGTGAAIIHAEEVSEEFKNTVFWFNVAIGSSLSVGIISISSLAAMILVEPRLEALLTFLSPVFFVGSLSISHQALLERQSKFKTIAIVEILSGFLALIGALVVAFNGGGVYALATQHLVGVVLTTIAYWTVSRWVPKFEMARSALGQALKYGGNIFIFSVVNYFHRNADSFLIGRFIGAADLGIYNVAYRILLFPLSNVTFVIARASFPAYSRGKADITKVGSHYLNTLGVIAFITAPMMAFIWALREPFIIVILGTKWLVSADVIAWLAPVGFFQSLVSTSGSVLSAIGRPDILRNLGFVGVPFLVLSIAVGIPWGIEGVATD